MTRTSGCMAVGALVAALTFAARPAGAEDALWVAKAQTIAMRVTAYGDVEPRSVLRLRAGVDGMLRDVSVQPGDDVAAGAVLGRLAGPPIDALLGARRAALAAAEATVKGAQQELAIERQKLAARLSTRGAVDKAEAAVSNARANRDSARAELSAAEDMAVLHAPQAGRVLTLNAAAGEHVAVGETLLTLLSAKDLWLRATLYGADANIVRAGMPGQFVPASGGAAIPVKVRAVVGALDRDGGRTVNLTAANDAPGWLDGEAGTVTVDAGTVSGVAVPTRALILDRAHWWVVVHTAKGDKPQMVTPGPRSGALTLIESGLAPGTAVVVANAYLEFHRGISERYQPPD
ncbi:MAG: efflux RND transporter periplasmic adaptor subunit [Alphaproteobacteria bacterium]|nr:efflux RND transporter periplasmic adaptor subunit [Alphaproteobacteria bacterium]